MNFGILVKKDILSILEIIGWEGFGARLAQVLAHQRQRQRVQAQRAQALAHQRQRQRVQAQLQQDNLCHQHTLVNYEENDES